MVVYGDGGQSRDFTYVDDVARGTIAGLKPLGYEVINLGSDAPVVLMDMIYLVEELTRKKAEIDYKSVPSGRCTRNLGRHRTSRTIVGLAP